LVSSPPTRRRFLQLASAGVIAMSITAAARPAEAADVEVTATLSSSQVQVGQAIYMQIQVATDGGRIGQPSLSGLDDVSVTAQGTSSGVSVSVGVGSRSRRATKTFTYVLSPRKAGEFEIGVEVEVDGEVRRPASKPKLTASGEALKPKLEVGKAGDAPQDPDAEVIVWPVVDKAKAYVGEQIVYELLIWERVNSNLSIGSAPTFKDFWSENLLPEQRGRRPTPERRFVAGVPYRVHQTMLRALFPQKAGTLTIGGPQIQMQPIVGLFGGGGGLPKTFAGRSLAIEVLPLPAEGQPPGFRPNNVGQLRIASEVDRTKLRQGEAVRLTVRIAGTGNIALVELPKLPELEGLRAYEAKPQTPQLSTGKASLEGSRIYTMLMVAEQPGALTIPALELPYFDPKTASYHVAKTKPITLQVEADPDAKPTQSPTDGEPRDDVDSEDDELLAPPIAGGELVRTTPRVAWLTRERWWLAILGAPAVIGLGWLGNTLARRYAPDERMRARGQELARRRTLLAEAGAAVESGDGFYPKLAALLQAAAVGRAGNEGVGLTRERLMRLLVERGVPSEEIDALRGLLDECDAARFGAGSGDVDQRRGHLERARDLLGKRSWGPS
jgi:hypothetical protein